MSCTSDLATLADTLFANARIHDDRPAIHWQGRWISYGEFKRRTRQLANALRGAGIGRGDRVCVLLSNRPECLECFFAITALGALVVPLNARLAPQEHVRIVQDAQPSLLISAAEHAESLRGIAAIQGGPDVVLTGAAPVGGARGYEEFIAGCLGVFTRAPLHPVDDAAIIYTSGTTSQPKGVVLTHDNFIADWTNLCGRYLPSEDSTNLQISPLYHASMCHSLIHLISGGRTVLMDRFDVGLAMQHIQAHRVTHIFAVPTVIYGFLEDPRLKETDLSSIRSICYGAAPMPRQRLEEAIAAFGNVFFHAFGLTETTSHCSLLTPEEHLEHLGSVGRPLPLCDMKVIGNEGETLPPGELREIAIRGRNVTNRYWRKPKQTAEAFIDGWFRSGDIGRVDEDGYYFLVDRKKDMIISGGVNIYPKDIEDVIALYPGVAEVAVIGIPDKKWGESVGAAIRPRPGCVFNEASLQEFLAGRIGKMQIPKYILIVEDFPRNATGKIVKYKLREQALTMTKGS